MIVWVVTNRLVIGWIFSLFWGVCHRSYPSTTTEVHCHLVTTKSDNMSCHCQHAIGRRLHVSRKVVWLDATHAVSSNKHSSLAIWSPTALPSPSEVCDYIGRSLPFFSVKQKEMSGLKEVFTERWNEAWWYGNSLFSITSTDDFCIHHDWMIVMMYCVRPWIHERARTIWRGFIIPHH